MTANRDAFKGIFTALLTPMLEDGAIDAKSLESLVEHQLRQGVKGFYVGGSTGEGFILTSEERKQALETVVRANRGKGTVIAHIGCISTRETVHLAKHAEAQGVDAISAIVPFYYKVGMREILEHYETIMAEVDVPIIVYHFPGATGVSLTMDFYEQLARRPKCIGVKFTSLNLFEMEQIRARCGDDFLIFNGHDEVYAGGALTAADGAIGSTFNIMPSLYVDMHRRASTGDWQGVRALQGRANEIIADLVRYDVMAYEKYVLFLQGVIRTPVIRQPLKQLTEAERGAISRFYENNNVLQSNAFVKA